jgi:hypothetical protein
MASNREEWAERRWRRGQGPRERGEGLRMGVRDWQADLRSLCERGLGDGVCCVVEKRRMGDKP